MTIVEAATVVQWLEGERDKFREHLSFFDCGGRLGDDTDTYVAWVKAKIQEFDALIAKHSGGPDAGGA